MKLHNDYGELDIERIAYLILLFCLVSYVLYSFIYAVVTSTTLPVVSVVLIIAVFLLRTAESIVNNILD